MRRLNEEGAPFGTPSKNAATTTAPGIVLPRSEVTPRPAFGGADHCRRFTFNPWCSTATVVPARFAVPAAPFDVSEVWFTSEEGQRTLRCVGLEGVL